jgi:hypothetical protein
VSFTGLLTRLTHILYIMIIEKIRTLIVAAMVIVVPQVVLLACMFNTNASEAIYFAITEILDEFNSLK